MSRPARRWLIALAVLLAPVLVLLACEWARWPFLQQPLERFLSQRLGRAVVFGKQFQLQLLGPVRVGSEGLRIDGLQPADSPLLLAEPFRLNVSWGNLLSLRRSPGDDAPPKPFEVRSLDVGRLEMNLQRSADGRANWQFRPASAQAAAPAASAALALPTFGRLTLNDGVIRVDDVPMAIQLVAKVQTNEGAVDARGESRSEERQESAVAAASAPAGGASAASAGTQRGLRASAEGRWRGQPLTAEMHASGLLPLANDSAQSPPVPMKLNAAVGRAKLVMNGTVRDLLHFGGLDAQFELSGPSLAAVGEPLRVTLPSTAPFDSHGRVRKNGALWQVQLAGLSVGSSRLGGNFDFDTAPAVHRLTGKLTGQRLALPDLGPAFGAPAPGQGRAGAAAVAAGKAKAQALAQADSRPPTSAPLPDARPPAKSASSSAKTAPAKTAPAQAAPEAAPAAGPVRVAVRGGRVLPQREFDLPSLRAMNADVQVQLASVDFGSDLIAPFAPLHAHVTLDGGVLAIRELQAENAGGRLRGGLTIDSRKNPPFWDSDLRWADLRLERFLKFQNPREGGHPYVTGLLGGHAKLQGSGRSTAAMLASLDGSMQLLVRQGTISHLSMELSGIDLAQSLGLLLRGDDALPMRCAAAHLAFKDGEVTPQVAVLDTKDTTLTVGGSLSLAEENLALILNASPHDFSPLALRGPVRVNGPFSAPQVKIDAKRAGLKVAAAAALGTVLTPLAAVLPLLDFGEADREVCGKALSEIQRRSTAGDAPARQAPAQAPVRGSGKPVAALNSR